MARILIGWELGGGSGHTVNVAAVAEELRRRGHDPVLAVQQTGEAPAGFEIWQAPMWPSLIATRGRRAVGNPNSFGDILVALGGSQEGVLAALLRAWDGILRAVRPDAVVAEFAPALLAATAGRWPSLALGTGFSLPPATLATFPSLTGAAPLHDERALLAQVNRELAAAGRAPLAALPALLRADRALVQCFRELDPYRDCRDGVDYVAPHFSGRAPIVDGRGEEVFLYLNGMQRSLDWLIGGLADSGLRVRMHDPRMREADIAVLEQAGITFERKPVPLERIAERSRLVISHTGLGFVSAALYAGLPHLALPYDLEKRATAAALVDAGLGRSVEYNSVDRAAMAALVADAFADEAMAARAIAAAPGFRTRTDPPSSAAAAEAAEALLAA
ncbi:UDP:flavonoid glycosyltransferase YjiC, YdhE family [Sphingomonas laterariae]|uniref:UDP:flavonoid glycosyltransferase YjiC, YdhE family n=1 Tax=Edaphosphingomonas laterariae TaxID=861865 RepID=A0A239E273_9SPHN|nr:glycosyltransferase [Sphingomonas laterariae]SNS38083.1 UDP:flavonoid glycosyltransferase YjiC, YdhE family [Sphingomonas laterariae]